MDAAREMDGLIEQSRDAAMWIEMRIAVRPAYL